MEIEIGDRIQIPVGLLEFNVEGNTIWIQSPQGSTLLRIKTKGKIKIELCSSSPTSHSDLIVNDDIHFCLGEDIL